MEKNKFFLKYSKINILVIMICTITVLSLTIGYSILSEKLDIKGTIFLNAPKDIRITNIYNMVVTDGGYEVFAPTFTTNTFTTSIGLENLSSVVSYTLTIKNYSSKTMQVSSIVLSANDNSNITYTINNLNLNTIFVSGEEKNFTVSFKYNNLIELLPNKVLNALIEINFKEYVEGEKNYILDNMILNLRGVDAPINGVWYDQVQNKPMVLNLVEYDSINKYYDFNAFGAHGKISSSILPTTGDFTLEAYIKLPATLISSDQAIVSQVADDKNDSGRIKLNFKDLILLTFLNRQKPTDTNISINYTSNVVSSYNYLLQLVRNNDKLDLYLDGVLISSNDYLATNTISNGPFKIGYWNVDSPQQYYGYVYAVRVYERALSNEELINNFEVDKIKYKGVETKYTNLYDYALGEQIVGTGSGLYIDNLNRYVYRGTEPLNYLKFNGDDDIYRILFYDTDKSMKIVNTSYKTNFAYDISGNRNLNTSTYCIDSETIADNLTNDYYGCNAWSSSLVYNNGTISGSVANDASINTFLNGEYYNTILNSNIKSKIINHNFAIGVATPNLKREDLNTSSLSLTWKGNIGLLTVSDVLNASISSISLSSSQTAINNYLISLSGSKDIIWTMTSDISNTYDVYAIIIGKSIGKRRSSRTNQVVSENLTYTMYASPSFYIDSNVSFKGVGSINDPFIIE